MKVWEGLGNLDKTEEAIKTRPASEISLDVLLLAECLGSLEKAIACTRKEKDGLG